MIDIKETSVIEITFYNKGTQNIETFVGMVMESNTESIKIVSTNNNYDYYEIPRDKIIDVSSCKIPDFLYTSLKEMVMCFKKKKDLEASIRDVEEKYQNSIENVKKSIFMAKYNPSGAVNLINNRISLFNRLNVDDNIISLHFLESDEANCFEVAINVSKKFEFYNTKSKEDIEKAADTYAPNVKNALERQFPMFKDIFITNKKINKIDDYLYESICEYNATMQCSKESFYILLENIIQILKGGLNNGEI